VIAAKIDIKEDQPTTAHQLEVFIMDRLNLTDTKYQSHGYGQRWTDCLMCKSQHELRVVDTVVTEL